MIESVVMAQATKLGHGGRNLTTHCSRPELASLSFDSLDAWLVVRRSAEFERWAAGLMFRNEICSKKT
jgi:hypothetical protein